MSLSDADARRYARQIMLDDIGEAGQQKLADTSVFIIGAGGLGSAAIAYLTAAGIGKIGIIDHDHVEVSNLQRQIIHEDGDVGRLKIESAADRVSELNPYTAVDIHSGRIRAENAQSLISRYDIIVDGSDNFATRFVVNEACFLTQKPLITGAVKGFEGQVSVFAPHLGDDLPCYQCFVPELPPEANNCTEVGVVGPLCGIIGSMQALEVLKLALGLETLNGKLLRYNAHSCTQTITTIPRDLACATCAKARATA